MKKDFLLTTIDNTHFLHNQKLWNNLKETPETFTEKLRTLQNSIYARYIVVLEKNKSPFWPYNKKNQNAYLETAFIQEMYVSPELRRQKYASSILNLLAKQYPGWVFGKLEPIYEWDNTLDFEKLADIFERMWAQIDSNAFYYPKKF